MGMCIISYQEVLRCLLKNVNDQAHEAVLCFGALRNFCLSLNCDS